MSEQGKMRSNFLNNAQITEVAEIELDRDQVLTDFGQKFIGFGSCFAMNMRRLLEPFGFHFFFTSEISAHYSTETLANIMEFIAGDREPSADDLYALAQNEVFLYRCHFKHRFYGDDAAERALTRMRELVALARAALEKTDFVLVTLGTTRVVRLKSNGQAIASAIRVDHEHWTLDALSHEQNIANFRRILRSIEKVRGGRPVTVFLTISPQRYLFGHLLHPGKPAHGGTALVDNFLGKAMLRVAVDQIVREGWNGIDLRYFPAFEIVYEELRQFETIAHYDYCHVDQVYTPERVVKKFLQTYASDAVLDQIETFTVVRSSLLDIGRLISGGMSKDSPEIQAQVDELLAMLSRFGEELSPPGIGLTYHLIEHFRPGQSIRDFKFRHMGFGNRLVLARNLAAGGDRQTAIRMARELIDELGARRTWDPDAGRDIEHRIYDEAAEFLRKIE